MTSSQPRRRALVKPPSRTRRGCPVEAGRLVAGLAAPALKKHGRVDAELRKRWPSLVGDKIARLSAPDRLRPSRGKRGGTLVLKVEGGAGTLIAPQAPFLIAVINQYYGWPAVERLEFAHGTVMSGQAAPPATPSPPPPAHSTPREALASLGQAIADQAAGAD